MQTHGGAPAEETILSREREIRIELLVDWNRDGLFTHALSDMSKWVDNVKVDRALKGSAPEEILLVEGYAAAELTWEANAETSDGVSFVSVFSPYNGNSPFYNMPVIGCEVKYRIGVETSVGTVWYSQFIGNIRFITPDRANNTVSFSALDRVEKLRRPVYSPVWAVADNLTTRGFTQAQLIESQNIIDHCLSFCDTSSTPLRPVYREELLVPDDAFDGMHVWMKGTGGNLPSVGWMDNAQIQTYPPDDAQPMYETLGVPHPDSPEPSKPPLALFANASPVGDENRYWAADRNKINAGGSHFMGFTLNFRGANSDEAFTGAETIPLTVRVGSLRRIEIHILNGEAWTEINDEVGLTSNESAHIALPTDVDSVRIDAIWDVSDSTGVRAWFRVGDVTTGTSMTTIRGPYGTNPEDLLRGLVIVHHSVSLCDVYYSVRNMFINTVSIENTCEFNGARKAKYVAVLDRGTNRLSFMPDMDGKEAWDVITDVAAAEFGSVFWDEDGYFHFWNLGTVIGKRATINKTLTTDDISDLSITDSYDSVRNLYTVSASKKTGSIANVYESKSVDEFYTDWDPMFLVTNEYIVFANDIQFLEPRYLQRYTTLNTVNTAAIPKWNDDVKHGYVLQHYNGSAWVEPDIAVFDVSVICWINTEGQIIVRITNGGNEAIRFATDSGGAAMHIEGTKINEFDDQVFQTRDQTSVNTYGGRTLNLTGEYYQEFFDFGNMTSQMLDRTKVPIPSTDDITTIGDPRIQLGDVLSIKDPDGIGEEFHVQIYGINREFSRDGGLVDTYTIEMIKPSGEGIWDSPQYGLWDETFRWSD